jgi:hypothetical protein
MWIKVKVFDKVQDGLLQLEGRPQTVATDA